MTAMTVRSDRNSGIVLIQGGGSNLDGDQALAFELPAGFGDCRLLDVWADVATIATVVANPELLGCTFNILGTPDSSHRDIVGVSRWQKTGAARLSTQLYPLQDSVLWLSTESLFVIYPELDSNVSPTGDLTVNARVMRLRNL